MTPGWVQTAGELAELVRALTAVPEVAVDTEGDSLHHYPARLALVQLGAPGAVWLVDPLAVEDLGPLGAIFGDARTTTVLHAGDNDLVDLKRRHGLPFARIFDTSVAARFLGAPALGLDVLLTTYLGVDLPPSRQKDDWSERPLSEAQRRYAVGDVEHLLPLKARLVEELTRVGRLAWVEEECAALAAQVVVERPIDPAAYAGLKGARELAPRGLAILRELHERRETLARRLDRPPFKVFNDEVLVKLALAVPGDREHLAQLPGMSPRVIGRWGDELLATVARALALPESELPVLERRPRANVPAAVRRRIESLRVWRTEATPRFGLEPGVLFPNRLIGTVAEAGPRDLDALARVEGFRRWRVEAFGPEILAALART
ncbi:MAG: ribonuclease D [Candidatus Rokubacteria bacterium]|nr:ribonuclease D [Candidatus Rokubacteria bacterium]